MVPCLDPYLNEVRWNHIPFIAAVKFRIWTLCILEKNEPVESWLSLSWCQDCSSVFLPTRSVVRLAASLLTKLVDSLAPSITSILVHGKQVSGHTDSRDWVADRKDPTCTNGFGLCLGRKHVGRTILMFTNLKKQIGSPFGNSSYCCPMGIGKLHGHIPYHSLTPLCVQLSFSCIRSASTNQRKILMCAMCPCV